MNRGAARRFPLLERYLGTRLGIDLSAVTPGAPRVVESELRLRRERSYGYVRGLWWIWLADGRSVVSVPPGAGPGVAEEVTGIASRDALLDPDLASRLTPLINQALRRRGGSPIDRVFHDLCFACDGSFLRQHHDGDCQRLTDSNVPPGEGLTLPTHCFPDGVVYGVVADGVVASVAYAHRAGLMEDEIADLGVATAPAYRRRGYARTAVSAVVEHFTRRSGEACYACSPDNEASRATALSVGFVRYGTNLVLGAPAF